MSLEHILLALLSDQPASGYELKKRIEIELDPLWRAEVSQIYPSLDRLRRAGFAAMKVVGPGRGPRSNRHRITPRGRRELERWWKEPLRPPDLRDESLLRVLASEAGGSRAFADSLGVYDRALSDEMARLRKKTAATVIAEAVRQAAIARLEAARRWARARYPTSS